MSNSRADYFLPVVQLPVTSQQDSLATRLGSQTGSHSGGTPGHSQTQTGRRMGCSEHK
jgi:hypothetical protein